MLGAKQHFRNQALVVASIILSAYILSACSGGEKSVISSACNIDSVDGIGGERFSVIPKKLVLNGWVADSTSKSAPSEVVLYLEDRNGNAVLTVSDVKRFARPDVAEFFKEDGYKNSGFEAVADVSKIKKGVYNVRLSMKRDGIMVVCKVPKELVIK